MSAVCTVRGPVATDQLGVTLMHEHIFILSPEMMANYPEAWAGTAAPFEDRGVTEEQIDAMLIHNPRRIFDAEGGY